jgi:hypothetical protein
MFYAIEYAYGSTVVNNGNRADKVYEFTAKRLRDAWVADGPPDITASGYRDKASARHPLVRNAIAVNRYDGDEEAWLVLAEQRVGASPALDRFRNILIGYGWREKDHARWVATASEREILAWAKGVETA